MRNDLKYGCKTMHRIAKEHRRKRGIRASSPNVSHNSSFFQEKHFEIEKYREYVRLYNDHVKKRGVFDPINI
jgi:hypothetical protein